MMLLLLLLLRFGFMVSRCILEGVLITSITNIRSVSSYCLNSTTCCAHLLWRAYILLVKIDLELNVFDVGVIGKRGELMALLKKETGTIIHQIIKLDRFRSHYSTFII